MKVAGIIAEYNPFHNGHQYQIKQIRKETGADYVVVIMSGNFLERGVPSITDKYSRTFCQRRGQSPCFHSHSRYHLLRSRTAGLCTHAEDCPDP